MIAYSRYSPRLKMQLCCRPRSAMAIGGIGYSSSRNSTELPTSVYHAACTARRERRVASQNLFSRSLVAVGARSQAICRRPTALIRRGRAISSIQCTTGEAREIGKTRCVAQRSDSAGYLSWCVTQVPGYQQRFYHNRTIPSLEVVRTRLPSGLNAALTQASAWPLRGSPIGFPVSTSHTSQSDP